MGRKDLKINLSKNKIIVFDREHGENYKLCIQEEKIEYVNEYVYFGKMFSNVCK